MAKKQIEGMEKELFSERERAEIWFAENWKKCLLAAVVAVAAASGVFAWRHFSAEREAAAAAALADASLDNIDAVARKYAGHPAIPAARLRIASGLMAEKKYVPARAEFLKVAEDAKAPVLLRSRARMNAAVCSESQGDIKAAIAEFSAIAEANGPDSPEAGFRAAGLMLRRTDLKGAEAMYASVAAMKGPENRLSDVWAIQSRAALAAIANGDFAPQAKPAGR